MSTPLFELHTIALLTLETLCDDKCSASARRPTTHNLSERLFPSHHEDAGMLAFSAVRAQTAAPWACIPPIGHINAFV